MLPEPELRLIQEAQLGHLIDAQRFFVQDIATSNLERLNIQYTGPFNFAIDRELRLGTARNDLGLLISIFLDNSDYLWAIPAGTENVARRFDVGGEEPCRNLTVVGLQEALPKDDCRTLTTWEHIDVGEEPYCYTTPDHADCVRCSKNRCVDSTIADGSRNVLHWHRDDHDIVKRETHLLQRPCQYKLQGASTEVNSDLPALEINQTTHCSTICELLAYNEC